MLGAFYAILAAATFGFNNASARRGVIGGTAMQGLVISMPLGLLTFLIGATLVDEWGAFSQLSAGNMGWLALAGFMHFVWGRYFNIRSLAAIGSNLAGPVQQSQLLLALALAIIVLGETLTPLKVIGIVLVVSAPMYILRQRARRKPPPETAEKKDYKPRLAEGYFYALMAALGFGSSGVLVKLGLDGSNLSFLGGVISYGTAFLVVAVVALLPSQFSQVRKIKKESAKWFFFSGVGVSFSQMFRYLALGIAPVTIVQPLQSLSLIFRMIFGYFINRDHEQFDGYVIFGICLSFTGALALTLSFDTVTELLDLPVWLQELAAWQWP